MILTKRGDGRVRASLVDGVTPPAKDEYEFDRAGRVAGDLPNRVYPRIEFNLKPAQWLWEKAPHRGWSVDDYETEEETEKRPFDFCYFELTPEEVDRIKLFLLQEAAKPKPQSWVDSWGRHVHIYNRGHITKYVDGYGASYECLGVGKPYQAMTDLQHGHCATLEEAQAAIDRANLEQGVRLSEYSALSYQEAKAQGVGATWRKPSFWGGPEVLTVVVVRPGYILSSDNRGQVYLSMGDADCEYACQLGQEQAFVARFEKPVDESFNCHYCGSPAVKFGFFNEPICDQCGG